MRSAEGYDLVVRPMTWRVRLVEVPVGDPHGIGRYWCYDTVEAAVLAGRLWPEHEPMGWVRAGGARQEGNSPE